MRRIHVPSAGLHYWVTLCVASILGCNTGDWFASFFGFLNGLPILLGAFGICLFIERRDQRPTQMYYWVAIVLVRTAATNLADFTTHSLRDASFAVLAVLLVAALASRRLLFRTPSSQSPSYGGLPMVDSLYWITMLLAGTLGTAVGDYVASRRTGLGLVEGSVALSMLVAVLVSGGTVRFFAFTLYYWATVVAIRAAGTAVGDFFARRMGLQQSTLVFAGILTLLVLWADRASRKADTAQAYSVTSP